MPGDYDKDCVESVLRDDPGKDKGEAIAICRAQQAAETGDVFDLEETKLEADELDLIADEGILSRAAVDGDLVWVTQDAEVAFVLEGGTGDTATPDDAGNSVEGKSESPLVAIGGLDEQTRTSIGTKSAASRSSAGPPRLSYPKKSGSNELDVDALPEEYQAALEADDFIVYGKASIEQYDTDDVPTKISMEALENALDRFFESETAPGIISFGHQDIPVGVPLEEYTLEDDAVIAHPDGETYEYDAGETIRSEVREDGDGDGQRELWLASNIANDTEMGKKLRLAALDGEINGYSVTIHRNDDEITQNGRRVTDVDLHAVTLGTDEQIKNKGSIFGVTEFKAALEGGLNSADDAVEQMAEVFLEALHMSQDPDDDTEQKSAADRLCEKLSLKGDDEQPDDVDDVDEKADDDDEDADDEDYDEKAGEDLEEVAQMVASVTDLGVDEAMMLLEEANGEADEQELKGEEAEPDSDTGDDTASFEAKFEAKAEEMGVLTEDALEEKLGDVASADTVEEKLDDRLDGVVTEDALEEKMSDTKQEIASAVGDEVDDVMQKARVGETPDPSADEGSAAQRVGDIFGGDN